MARIDELLTTDQLRELVTRFYDRVYTDEVLGPMFAKVGRERQEQRLLAFVKMTAEAGSERWDGPYLRGAHEDLALTDALFDRRTALLVEAARACGHGDEVAEALRAYDERWRSWVLGV